MTQNAKLQSCSLCPHECKVNRTLAQKGICGQTDEVRLARAALHFWEEPPISGACGSGTVFFSGCTLHCVYCQNKNIASGAIGKGVSLERLADIFIELQQQGALNINLVTPTHYVPQICVALDSARKQGLNIPIVYNSSGYERVEVIKCLKSYIDIYLTDFKYCSSQLSKRYSGAKDYCEKASAALDEMQKHARVIVRHLILPGCVDDSKKVLQLLSKKPYANNIKLSIMSQYTPMLGIENDFAELARPITDAEYEEVLNFADSLGFEDYFWQDGEANKESFIPDFNYQGV